MQERSSTRIYPGQMRHTDGLVLSIKETTQQPCSTVSFDLPYRVVLPVGLLEAHKKTSMFRFGDPPFPFDRICSFALS